MTYSIRITLILLFAGVVLPATTQTAFAQTGLTQETPTNYDFNFLDRDPHKIKPTFMVNGNDFHKHSYHRMLLNSPMGRSSIGLGVNGKNPVFNSTAFDMMHPEASGINEPTPTERLFIENAYAPKVKKGYNAAYETDKAFGREPNAVTTNTNKYFSDNTFENSSTGGSQNYTDSTNSGLPGSTNGNGSQSVGIKEILNAPAQPQIPKDRIPSFLKDDSAPSNTGSF